jgi:methionyl-tRNA synthetase
MTPQDFVDSISLDFMSLWSTLHISNNLFIRTTDKHHEQVVQKVFSELLAQGHIYMGTWESLYCVNCEEAYTESRAITHENGEKYCEVGHKLITKSEPSYFFRMSDYTNWIEEYYKLNPESIYPTSRINEIMNSFVKEGIEDLSVSRMSVKWGIPVKENPDHVIYVWIDALLNYLTALGYKQPDDQLFQKLWNDESTEIVHLMSKEITRFHCVYWPIMLKCLNLRQPSKVISHGW